MEKAFVYLRVSGKGQVGGDGFPRQQLACETYCRGNDMKIVRVFREKGVPGATDLENRPALASLLEALSANDVRVVVTEKLDRLARDLIVQESIIADFQKRGFRIISALEPDLCCDDPSRILMRRIFGAFADYEKTMLCAKLRGARQRKRSRGEKCEGPKFYGHTHEEQETMRYMCELRDGGMNYTHITNRLNAEKVPTRRGSPWQVKTVINILKREVRH